MPTHSVTCVIPTHHRDDSLRRAVESVLRQTVRPQRVVIADDTGRDLQRPSLQRVIDLAPELVEVRDSSKGPQPGASQSRNVGANGASSDLLAFLDDDDVWLPAFLAKTCHALSTSRAEMVISWGAISRGNKLKHHNWRATPGKTARDVVADNPGFTGSNFVIRRTAFEMQNGFDPGLRVFNDLDFLVRFLSRGGTYTTVEEDLVHQIVEEGEHLSSRSEKRAQGIEKYAEKHKDLLDFSHRRRLRREAHIARLFDGQSTGRRAANIAGVVINLTPSYVLAAVSRRVRNDPGYN